MDATRRTRLSLTRKVGESVELDLRDLLDLLGRRGLRDAEWGRVTICVQEIRGTRVRLLIMAPASVRVRRGKIGGGAEDGQARQALSVPDDVVATQG